MNAFVIRDYVAAKLDETSRWRAHKAEMHPDDARNKRSAMALQNAASYVRELQVQPMDADVPVGMRNILRLSRACKVSNPWVEMPWGEETTRVAGRHGFDSSLLLGEDPYESSDMIDGFLDRLYMAMLDDVVEQLTAGETIEELTPALREALGPERVLLVEDWTPEDDDIEAEDGGGEDLLRVLRELRDLLNERLPA